MISVVLYGRNDSYGYNLHKRAALSFNCIAELLTDPDDEILFVDYNTPDDFPTFPEAIQDTLTDKARARLRILRLRPSVHARFKHKTHLQALEPVARNVAIRRSNPANRWILSTNTDMIFVPRESRSLSDIVRNLPKGYYGIPRFEIPETLWETLNRQDPVGTIATVGAWGWQFHLNEIVLGAPVIKFDAPGDFQLIDREDLFKIHGFDEEMLLGWHVDSNICKRLFLMYEKVGDLTGQLFGYHCDHTRQVTPAHKRTAVENSSAKFVDQVDDPQLSKQAQTWGCADASIEEVRLNDTPSRRYVDALTAAIRSPMRETAEAQYIGSTYDVVGYSADHVLPYLADVLASAPRDWNVAWFGTNRSMRDLFARAWPIMGFTGQFIMPLMSLAEDDKTNSGIVGSDIGDLCAKADIFIFDFSASGGQALGQSADSGESTFIKTMLRNFFAVIAAEHARMADGTWLPRRVIAINAIHNRFESLMHGNIEYARSPFSGRLRHGYVLPPIKGTVPWLDLMVTKRAAERDGKQIRVRQFVRGPVLSGPFLSLPPGRYCVVAEIAPKRPISTLGWLALAGAALLTGMFSIGARVLPETHANVSLGERKRGDGKWRKASAVAIEILNGDHLLSRNTLSAIALWRQVQHRVNFTVNEDDALATEPVSIRVRIWTGGLVGFTIETLDLMRNA